jgi:hypothetical protein
MSKETKKYPGLWPTDKNGCDLPTQIDPVTGVTMCRDCWDQNHKRGGCKQPGCLCGCYNGNSKGLSFAHPPAKNCEANQKLPDVGTITV